MLVVFFVANAKYCTFVVDRMIQNIVESLSEHQINIISFEILFVYRCAYILSFIYTFGT